MSRPRKLNDDVEALLRSRIEIARTALIPKLTQNSIADGFDISVVTLRRYYFPNERSLSVRVAIRRYHSQGKVDRKHCAYCDEALLDHARCLDCTILMHDGREYCESCLEARERAIIKAYGTRR